MARNSFASLVGTPAAEFRPLSFSIAVTVTVPSFSVRAKPPRFRTSTVKPFEVPIWILDFPFSSVFVILPWMVTAVSVGFVAFLLMLTASGDAGTV